MAKQNRIKPIGSASSNGQHAGQHATATLPAAGSKKPILKIAICGLGRAAMGLLKREVLAMKEVQIVGVFDLLRERSDALAKQLGCRVYDSYEQLLADPTVELVVVATRSVEHTPMAIQGLASGKHVLVEKPMGVNLKQVDQLLNFAKKAKGRLFVRHNRRFEPAFLQVKDILATKKLGDIFQFNLRLHKFQMRNDWQTLKRFGGGQLLNWGPHLVDWGLRLLDSPVADIWCDLKCVAAAGDAEDTIKLLIRGENGVVVDIEISDAVALPQPAWVVYGSRGTLAISGTTCTMRYLKPKLKVSVKADASTPSALGGYAGPAKLEWVEETFEVSPKKPTKYFHELYKTLKRGADFPVTLEQARENLRVIGMARRGTKFG